MRKVHFTSVMLTTFTFSLVVWLFIAFRPVSIYHKMYPSVEIIKWLWLFVASLLFVYTCYRYFLRWLLLRRVKKVAKGVLDIENTDKTLLKRLFSMTKKDREGSFFETHYVLVFFLLLALVTSFLLEGFLHLVR